MEVVMDLFELGLRPVSEEIVGLTPEERSQGTYIIGTTGTGKSTLLRNMIFQDMHPAKKHGLCVLDPHGDLIDEILGLVPNERADDVILLNPMDEDFPFGLNLLACDRTNSTEVRWVISTVVETLRRQFSYSWGPRLQHVLTNALETIIRFEGSTFIELSKLLSNKDFRKQVISQLDDPILKEFWSTFPEGNVRLEFDMTASVLNKIGPFVTDLMMRFIVGQSKNTFDLKEIMKDGKILLVNLSKGNLGEVNSALLGSVLVNLVLIAALSRRSGDANDRRQFHLYVDEFQNFATESFAILQSEARKYNVDVTVAHQYRDQLDDLSKGSTLNVGNLIIFRTTGRDGYDLASQFDNTPPEADTRMQPIFQQSDFLGNDVYVEAYYESAGGKMFEEVKLPRRSYHDVEAERANKLSILPDWQAYCRLIHKPQSRGQEYGHPGLREYHIKTQVLDNGRSQIKKQEMANRIKKNSRKNYAKPRKVVEREIEERESTMLKEVETKSYRLK
jgi:hypothetical protein